MKKIYLFMTMAMMAFATAFTACEDEQVNPNNNDPQNNGDENANYQMYSFNTTLNYNSTKASTGSAFCASTRQAVPATSSDADFCVGTQGQYGTFVCSPNASLLKQCYDANGITYSNNKSAKIQDLGYADIQDYYDVNTLENMSVSSDYLDGKSSLGVGVNQLSSGQVIAFQTSDGCKGVAKMSFSKVTKAVSISGYVAVPKNSSGK
ncbi:MAG: hypothetical protein II939_05400 [Bacteroidales bacterium]|jgi:hypothetical protein|nr:hypothetical protein [Bacteroidales bacterium]